MNQEFIETQKQIQSLTASGHYAEWMGKYERLLAYTEEVEAQAAVMREAIQGTLAQDWKVLEILSTINSGVPPQISPSTVCQVSPTTIASQKAISNDAGKELLEKLERLKAALREISSISVVLMRLKCQEVADIFNRTLQSGDLR